MKVAVIGSREFTNYSSLFQAFNDFDDIEQILSLENQGCLEIIKRYSKEYDTDIKLFPEPESMLKDAHVLIAFWDGKSKGTKSVIELAKKLQKPVDLIKI